MEDSSKVNWEEVLQDMQQRKEMFEQKFKESNENEIVATSVSDDYVLTEEGKGINGTSVGINSFNPLIVKEGDKIFNMKVMKSIISKRSYSNGKGKIIFEPVLAMNYWEDCAKSLGNAIEMIKNTI